MAYLNAGADFDFAGRKFGRQDADLPAVFIGDQVIDGEARIKDRLGESIRKFKENPEAFAKSSVDPFQSEIDAEDAKAEAFSSLTFGLVLGAGLLDGLNPCAFATIILLVSYLTLFGADQRKVLWTGATFTLGVFPTYLAIGLLFFHSLRQILTDATLSSVVNGALLIVVLVLGVICLVDAVRVLRGEPSRRILKLTQSGNRFVERMVAGFSRSRSTSFGAPFLLGVVVSGLEFTCTGQVYVPIVTMLSNPEYRLPAFAYLVAYNLAFILPLVVVFFGAAFGGRFINVGRSPKFMALSKLTHSAVFFLMAAVIAHNLGWLT